MNVCLWDILILKNVIIILKKWFRAEGLSSERLSNILGHDILSTGDYPQTYEVMTFHQRVNVSKHRSWQFIDGWLSPNIFGFHLLKRMLSLLRLRVMHNVIFVGKRYWHYMPSNKSITVMLMNKWTLFTDKTIKKLHSKHEGNYEIIYIIHTSNVLE